MASPIDPSEYSTFIRRVREGDDRAAEELVRLYEPEIRLEVRGWLRLRDPRLRRVFDSTDICQSVLAQFFVRAAIGEFDLDEPTQLIRLLVGMARNKLSEEVRSSPPPAPGPPPRRAGRPRRRADRGRRDPGGDAEPGRLAARAAPDGPQPALRGGAAACRAPASRIGLGGRCRRDGRDARGPAQAARPRDRSGRGGARARLDPGLKPSRGFASGWPPDGHVWVRRPPTIARARPFPRRPPMSDPHDNRATQIGRHRPGGRTIPWPGLVADGSAGSARRAGTWPTGSAPS